MGRNRNVVQGITAWVGKQTPSGGWTWAVPVSCFGCIYFLGDEGAGGVGGVMVSMSGWLVKRWGS